MYKTKQMSYNTKEKPTSSCTDEYLSKTKEHHEIQPYQTDSDINQ